MINKDNFISILKETGLYVITDTSIAGISHYEIVKRCVEGGAKIIQIRDKAMSDSEMLITAQRIIKDFPDKYLIINDRVDVAVLSKAAGVHLGQDDIPVEYARKLLDDNAVIGISTHSNEQFKEALNKDVDYIAIGPVFYTTTKISNDKPLGINYAMEKRSLTNKCIVAIGGINLENAVALWECQIDAVAVISDIMNAKDITERVASYIEKPKSIKKLI